MPFIGIILDVLFCCCMQFWMLFQVYLKKYCDEITSTDTHSTLSNPVIGPETFLELDGHSCKCSINEAVQTCGDDNDIILFGHCLILSTHIKDKPRLLPHTLNNCQNTIHVLSIQMNNVSNIITGSNILIINCLSVLLAHTAVRPVHIFGTVRYRHLIKLLLHLKVIGLGYFGQCKLCVMCLLWLVV